MSLTVCLSGYSFPYEGCGGHLWVYLNWALGLRSVGCRVLWLEVVKPDAPPARTASGIRSLRDYLAPYDLSDSVVVATTTGGDADVPGVPGLDAAADADLLLSLRYDMADGLVRRFRRSALIDIDPGLLQAWVSAGGISLARHDSYFTIGENIGAPGMPVPDLGFGWQQTRQCVALEWWPATPTPMEAAFTTVSQWWANEWVGDENGYRNDKRSGFVPFLDLPRLTGATLELALALSERDADERTMLEGLGWRVRNATEVASTPNHYQRYIQNSLAEFSCVKPSCIKFQNAWVSDRTLCYLASGKPAVVQHTGPSRFLPDRAGLLRFHDVAEAVDCVNEVLSDPDRQARAARALAEEYFDARKVTASLLERAVA
jgi:hypothetical protein